MHLSSAHTLKLRHAIQELVDAFVCEQRYLPPGAHTLTSSKDLPPRLQLLARRRSPLATWRAWTDQDRFWFIAARLCNPSGVPAGLLALEIVFFDRDGRSAASGVWTLRSDGHWALRRVIETSGRSHRPGATALRSPH
jgi:hypothetical protein